jgi:hypothetical protein
MLLKSIAAQNQGEYTRNCAPNDWLGNGWASFAQIIILHDAS